MPANTNPIFKAIPRTEAVALANANGTTSVLLFAADTKNGSIIEAIGATTTDTSAVEIDLTLFDGTNSFPLGSATIPVGAGTNGGTTPAVDVLNATDLPWLRSDLILILAAGWSLKVAAHAAITSGKVATVFALGGDY